jgi:hypothetical protein
LPCHWMLLLNKHRYITISWLSNKCIILTQCLLWIAIGLPGDLRPSYQVGFESKSYKWLIFFDLNNHMFGLAECIVLYLIIMTYMIFPSIIARIKLITDQFCSVIYGFLKSGHAWSALKKIVVWYTYTV